MGRIKTQFVKRTSHKLIELHGDKFCTEYVKNKETLKGLAVIQSPKIRNVIAGYLTRLKRAGDKEEI
ncbi:MAG: 30S ribosomal protein S17e [Nanoarchaeota archaeon]